MRYQLHALAPLTKILWLDGILGAGTALPALFIYGYASRFLGLPVSVVLIIAVVTLAYAAFALSLARRQAPPAVLVRFLIYANWVWTGISVLWLIFFIHVVTLYGAAFLVLQVLVVAGLALVESRYLRLTGGMQARKT
ncbi:hypothetical protein C7T94_02280 [Pedobacter yulinensis]|uniref:Integral membrane protein n=1 Tax=Pedobacter yulinensis TaxID=2126353 RepID=A0A2T3HRA2_9SPHI|nr:hypothetical protein [Pedobacter yulinensis]PST84968.1 hypothetical protein C7T94_02280 [Pedobacter yulinensis]